MVDVRALNGSRPTGQRAQVIVSGYVSTEQPAPASFTDPLYVVIGSVSSEISFEFQYWPVLHGNTLPVAGTVVRLGYDDNRVPYVAGWDGPNT